MSTPILDYVLTPIVKEPVDRRHTMYVLINPLFWDDQDSVGSNASSEAIPSIITVVDHMTSLHFGRMNYLSDKNLA